VSKGKPRTTEIVFDEEPPHDVFLATAQGFLDAGHYDPAVVSAQTAYELATELALWFWFGQLQRRQPLKSMPELARAPNEQGLGPELQRVLGRDTQPDAA
jgi:hypothetical protein